jgi:hypothetical protein
MSDFHYHTHPSAKPKAEGSRISPKGRWIIVLAVCALGMIWGSWTGLLAVCLFILLPLGIFFPYREPRQAASPDSEIWEKVDTARRGSEYDPTRPDEHPLLLTHEMKGRR